MAYSAKPNPHSTTLASTSARTRVGLHPTRCAMALHTPAIHRSSPRSIALPRIHEKNRSLCRFGFGWGPGAGEPYGFEPYESEPFVPGPVAPPAS